MLFSIWLYHRTITNNRTFCIGYFWTKIWNKFRNTGTNIAFRKYSIDKLLLSSSRELLQRFKTQELIHWKDILKNFETDLKQGSKDDTATSVFANTDDGKKCWEDFKIRVVEHVSLHPSLREFHFLLFYNRTCESWRNIILVFVHKKWLIYLN